MKKTNSFFFSLILIGISLLTMACGFSSIKSIVRIIMNPAPSKLPEPTVVIQPELVMPKNIYEPGEQVNLYYRLAVLPKEDAWIGIMPAEVSHGNEAENEQAAIEKQALGSMMEGVMIFSAPGSLGDYEIRIFDSDENGIELLSQPIKVTDIGAEQVVDSTFKLVKEVYSAGEPIILMFTVAPWYAEEAWVGIIPTHENHGNEVENFSKSIVTQTLDGRKSGILIFDAPGSFGIYDFRMNEKVDGTEIATMTFRVED